MESDDDIVISGMAGHFPECHNVEEFQKALLEGVDLITVDDKRFPAGIWGTPERSGKIPSIDKFDAGYFGIHPKLAGIMEPRHRILAETVYESIIDAGYNPKELRGSATGVYVGMSAFTNNEAVRDIKTDGYANMGLNLALTANRISYSFDFTGPSYVIDTACSSSMFAFSNAISDLKNGVTDGAVVAGAHIVFHPHESLEFLNLNMLAPDGKCKVFATNRDGYVRSEAIVSLLLQKRSRSRRVYATVLGARTNADGFKPEGITLPSAVGQITLIETVYREANISPSIVSYVEAHGTGTPAGDLMECQAITSTFCKSRTTPLPIGSVKTNMGHSEMSSGVCSIVKVLTAMETGVIPGNLHTESLDTTLPGICDNKLKVLTENQSWDGGIVGINSFGFGGANAHLVLKSHAKEKKKNAYKRPKHRLVQVSGRTEEAVDYFLDRVKEHQNDEEFLALVDEIHKMNVDGHTYRGYAVLGDNPKREVQKYKKARPIWFIYSGMGSQWLQVGRDLLKIPQFRNTFERCATALKPYNLDLMDIVTSDCASVFDDIMNCFVAIGCIEVALTDVLFSFGISPDGIAGHSLGEVCCSYADGLVTAEEAALLTYARGYASKNAKLPVGQMAAVGLSKEVVRDILPPDIFIACQNGKESVTISGPKASTETFVDKLSSQGVFAKLVKSADIAFHTKYVKESGDLLLEFVKGVLKNPKPRTTRWVSSSVPPSKADLTWAKLNSPEYHHNNFSNTVLFDQVYEHIPDDAIVIEVAPHGLLQAILRRELSPNTTYISLVNRSSDDNEQFLLSAIGKIFNAGGQPQLKNWYNNVSFPVSRGTPVLSSLVKWDHSNSWFVPMYIHPDSFGAVITVDLNDTEYSHLKGHFVDGRVLMPATGYLALVWKALGNLLLKSINELPVVMENIKFKRATILPADGEVKFLINITKQSGNFEIFEGGSIVVTGKIRTSNKISSEFVDPDRPQAPKDCHLLMTKEDIYQECKLRKYAYADLFQGLVQSDVYGLQGRLEWKGKFDSFMDTMLHISIISQTSRDLLLPTKIQQAIVDPVLHLDLVSKEREIDVINNQDINVIKCGGIELVGVDYSRVARKQTTEDASLESYEFIYYEGSRKNQFSSETSLNIALQIVIQNYVGLVKKLKICELTSKTQEKDMKSLVTSILDKEPFTEIEYCKTDPSQLSEKYDVLLFTEHSVVEVNGTSVADYITENGFILYIGPFSRIANYNLDIIFQSISEQDSTYLLRPFHEFPAKYAVVNIRNTDFDWLEKVKVFAESDEPRVIYIFSQEEISGVTGFLKCLSTEPTKVTFRSVLIDKNTDIFSIDDEFYRNQLKKNLAFNVLRNNDWGTHVHLPLETQHTREVTEAYATIKTTGDLTSLCWMERPSLKTEAGSDLVHVFYSALNFRDVMMATGKLQLPPASDPTAPDISIGLEYAGVTGDGRRVMGIVEYGGTGVQIKSDPEFTWEVPESWSMEEAATVPCVYATCYYALFLRGRLQPGDSILIHAGTGGIGMAAISIALNMGCEVCATVGSNEKREYLKRLFPTLQDKNIGNSRNKSFEKMVMKNTRGKGVDFILNSLAEELFQASLRCLGRRGNFLEIGKVDFYNGTLIDSKMFLKNCSFHGVLIDDLFGSSSGARKQIQNLLEEGIRKGVVRPLPRTVYKETELEPAFRFLSSGKHKGKVLIEIRKETTEFKKSLTKQITATPKLYFDPAKSYIIIGGLGGFGLELANWAIRKGATKIVLNSRRLIWNGYQSFCMKKWSQYQGVSVKVNTDDTTHLIGTEQLIRDAETLGPVGGIFSSAAVVKDDLIVNQSKSSFQEVFKPKLTSCQNLDTVTRKLCPHLDHFVVFSSIACGRGNFGQTNYGMANSAMEMLCENRKRANLPALAVQWGPVADVGMLQTKELTSLLLNYLKPSSISSCLNTLEVLMLQSCTITSSLVLADKDCVQSSTTVRSPAESVAHILGLSNLSSVDEHITLTQLGLDSLMLSEIKQTFYRNYQLDLSNEEIRDLTFGKLSELTSGKPNAIKSTSDTTTPSEADTYSALNFILEKETVVKLSGSDKSQRKVFVIHSIEGNVEPLVPLANQLKAEVYGLQCTKDCSCDSMQDLAAYYILNMKCIQPQGPYCICGYSFGSAVALEMGIQLEKQGDRAHLVLIDGSPAFVKQTLGDAYLRNDQTMERDLMILGKFASSFRKVSPNEVSKILRGSQDWKGGIKAISELIGEKTGIDSTEVADSADKFYQRCRAGVLYKSTGSFLGKVLLIRKEEDAVQLPEDYDLKSICEQKVEVVKMKAGHRTILMGECVQQVANTINATFSLLT